MWVSNISDPARRHFDNNICAFHVGNGLILSVAHNLRTEAQLLKSIDETIYQTEIVSRVDPAKQKILNNAFSLDRTTSRRHLQVTNQTKISSLIDAFSNSQFDTRWNTLTQRGIATPFLIVQFSNNQYYNDQNLTNHFPHHHYFHEPNLNKHTFLIELELVTPFYKEDMALYRIVNTNPKIISRLSSIEMDFRFLDDNAKNIYCLQSAPTNNLGRLLNVATIEGLLDHWAEFFDRFSGNYIIEGSRYLVKGYFRFGSSGAPYIKFDEDTNRFKVIAVQSEACPIQLSINNNKDGNFQYINAIATPLNNIQSALAPYA
jgi:hypothetical protein